VVAKGTRSDGIRYSHCIAPDNVAPNVLYKGADKIAETAEWRGRYLLCKEWGNMLAIEE
jgi:hypothetical protein